MRLKSSKGRKIKLCSMFHLTWVLFILEVVISLFRGKNWMKSLNSSISFYIYLEDKLTKTWVKTLHFNFSLGIENMNITLRQPSVSSLPTWVLGHKDPREQNWIQRVTGPPVLFEDQTQPDGPVVQVGLIILMQNLSQMTFQWHLLLSKTSMYSRVILSSYVTGLSCWKLCLMSLKYSRQGVPSFRSLSLSHLRQKSLVVGSGIAVPFWKGNINRDVFLLFVIHSREY